MPLPMIKSITWQLMQGLAYLHRLGIMHRDLKPANVLVAYTATGDIPAGRVLLGTFSLSHYFVSETTYHVTSGFWFGTFLSALEIPLVF